MGGVLHLKIQHLKIYLIQREFLFLNTDYHNSTPSLTITEQIQTLIVKGLPLKFI